MTVTAAKDWAWSSPLLSFPSQFKLEQPLHSDEAQSLPLFEVQIESIFNRKIRAIVTASRKFMAQKINTQCGPIDE